MKIMIDPGHYGWDSGAVGPAGTYERDITMAVALILAPILQQAGIEVNMTRQPGQLQIVGSLNEDLYTRVQAAENWGADFFLSIHCNAHADQAAHGMEVYTTPGQGQSDGWAESILNSMMLAFPNLTLRTDTSDGDMDKEASFYVIRKTTMAAVLVEMAFISNPDEEQLLASAAGQQQFAQTIAAGILQYAGLAVPQTTNLVADAIAKLAAGGVIGSPDYWLSAAQAGQTVPGETVAQLIKNFAAKI